MKMYNANKLTTMAMLASLILCGTACKKSSNITPGNSGSSMVSIYLTDDPSLVFDNLFIDIQKVEVKAEDDSEGEGGHGHEGEHSENDRNGSGDGGWITLTIHPGLYDLLKFRNGLDTILGSANFSNTRNLKKIRVTLGVNNSVILHGISIPLVIKDKNNIVVIDLEELPSSSGNGKFQLSIDIDASRSVRQHGNEFELNPQVKSFNRAKTGGIEGTILHRNAHALVLAINGIDTATAMPEREGEFKIVGLKDGNYTLLVHATADNYRDTILHVRVAGNEDTHVDVITLHK